MNPSTVGKIKPQPANKKAILGYTFLSLIFFGLGVFCFILILNTYNTEIGDFFNDILLPAIVGSAAVLADYWWIILTIVIGLIIFGFLVGWLLLVMVAKYGNIIVYAGGILTIIGGIVGGIVMLFIPGMQFASLSSFIPAAIMVFAFATSMNKIKRAGEFLKFTGQVILAEKGMILAPLFVSGVSVLNALAMASIFAELVLVFQGSAVGYVLASLASLVQLIIYFGIFYAAEGINTTYAYEWYRKRDPNMRFCIKNVAGNFGPIFLFGVTTAIVSWLQQVLRNAAARSRRQGNIAGLVLAILARIVASLLGIIFKYLTYFTLPAIVVEGRKFKEGIERSADLLKRYFMDVLIRETGVSRGMSIIQWIAFLIYGAAGAIVGFILYLSTGATLATSLLITIIPALVLAFVPTFFIFRPMKTAYLTFIFAYAQDEETSFRLPTRMPKELRGDIRDASSRMDTGKSIVNIKGF
jgi:hypothetical protein